MEIGDSDKENAEPFAADPDPRCELDRQYSRETCEGAASPSVSAGYMPLPSGMVPGRVLGSGAYGSVYLIEPHDGADCITTQDERSGTGRPVRPMALKVCTDDGEGDCWTGFLREADTMARIAYEVDRIRARARRARGFRAAGPVEGSPLGVARVGPCGGVGGDEATMGGSGPDSFLSSLDATRVAWALVSVRSLVAAIEIGFGRIGTTISSGGRGAEGAGAGTGAKGGPRCGRFGGRGGVPQGSASGNPEATRPNGARPAAPKATRPGLPAEHGRDGYAGYGRGDGDGGDDERRSHEGGDGEGEGYGNEDGGSAGSHRPRRTGEPDSCNGSGGNSGGRAPPALPFITQAPRWILMPYAGKPLGEFSKGLDPESRCRLLPLLCGQLLAALALLHSMGIAHRDVKPDNILVDESRPTTVPGIYDVPGPTLSLCDFGLAKDMRGGYHTGGVCTLNYRAPELVVGTRIYDHKVDVWSAGVSLVEFVSARTAFRRRNSVGMFEALQEAFREEVGYSCMRSCFAQEAADLIQWLGDPLGTQMVYALDRMLKPEPRNRPACLDLLRSEPFACPSGVFGPPSFRPAADATSVATDDAAKGQGASAGPTGLAGHAWIGRGVGASVRPERTSAETNQASTKAWPRGNDTPTEGGTGRNACADQPDSANAMDKVTATTTTTTKATTNKTTPTAQQPHGFDSQRFTAIAYLMMQTAIKANCCKLSLSVGLALFADTTRSMASHLMPDHHQDLLAIACLFLASCYYQNKGPSPGSLAYHAGNTYPGWVLEDWAARAFLASGCRITHVVPEPHRPGDTWKEVARRTLRGFPEWTSTKG